MLVSRCTRYQQQMVERFHCQPRRMLDWLPDQHLCTPVCQRGSPKGCSRTMLEVGYQLEHIREYWRDMLLECNCNRLVSLSQRIVACSPWPPTRIDAFWILRLCRTG